MSAGGEVGGANAMGAPADPLSLGSGRGRWVVAATVLGSGIALLDSTVVGIALPSIGREFHGGVGTLQWVVTGYTLTLAAFLLLGARSATVTDASASSPSAWPGSRWRRLSAASRPTAGVLIVARVVQGDRRRVVGARQPGHPPGLFPSRRPGPRHRRLVRVQWRGRCRRPAGGRLSPRHWLVALGLLHQPPPRRRRARDHRPSRPRVAGPHGQRWRRHRRRHPGRRVPRRLDLRADRGPHAGVVEPGRGGVPRGGRPGRARLPPRRAPPAQSHAPARSCSAPASSAGPTASPSPSTAPSVARCSCSPSSCRSSRATRHSSPGSRSFRSPLVMLAFSARSGALSARIGPRLQMTAGPLVVAAGLALLTRATTPAATGRRSSRRSSCSPAAWP